MKNLWLELPENSDSYLQSLYIFLEWLEVDNIFLFCSKIYIPDIYDLHRYIVSLYHDIKVARHAEC